MREAETSGASVPREGQEPTVGESQAEEWLSVAEAAERYGVPKSTLVGRLRVGEIPAHKVRTGHGREWRVSTLALEAFGYRTVPPQPQRTISPEVAELQRTVRALKRELAHERSKTAQLDSQLGDAALEIGRLRAALARREESHVVDVREAGAPGRAERDFS